MAEHNTNVDKIWQQTLNRVRRDVLRPSFETWLKNSRAVELDLHHGELTVAVPHEFARNWVEDNYAPSLEQALSTVMGSDTTLNFVVSADSTSDLSEDENLSESWVTPQSPEATITKKVTPSIMGSLNPKYTFANFVVGNSNRLAHAACAAVAQAPARAYNPLFLYGGVGLGKTHLMQAIAHRVMEDAPNTSVVYVSSERFANELINSIRDTKTTSFRNRYRNVDILMVDDIQFLAGKERTQEEFFHTFNALHEANKQIVISSDRPPKEIPTLEERLRSRFEWGLISDIQPPDLETRIAILRKKAGTENLNVPDDTLRFIAENITSNIRELEGALIRLVAYASLRQQYIDMELAEDALRDLIPQYSKNSVISIQTIQEIVCQHYGIHLSDINGRRRTQTIVFPRQLAMFLARELTDHSLPQIGADFGGRDHSTVIHAYNKIKEDLEKNQQLQNIVVDLTQRIQAHK